MGPSTYMQDIREIPAIVNEKIVIKCANFHTLDEGTSLIMALENRQTDLHALNNFSSSIVKVSFKTRGECRERALCQLTECF